MAIEGEKQEVDGNALLEEGLSAEGLDREFLASLEASENEFEGSIGQNTLEGLRVVSC